MSGAELSRKVSRFDLTQVFFVIVCLTFFLRLPAGWLVCSVCSSLFEDSCFTRESAQACFAFARSTAEC